jgi:hypothetical protein
MSTSNRTSNKYECAAVSKPSIDWMSVILSVTEGGAEEPALSVVEGICFTLYLEIGAKRRSTKRGKADRVVP